MRSLAPEPEPFDAAPEADTLPEEVAENRAHDDGRRVGVHALPSLQILLCLTLIAMSRLTTTTTARAKAPSTSILPPFPHHPLVRFAQS
jgi:hypothetical protein